MSVSSTRAWNAPSAAVPSAFPSRSRNFPTPGAPERATMSSQQRIAIVGMGGLFPPGVTPAGLWDLVLAGADASRAVPPGRWLLDPEETCVASGVAPDRVCSLRGYFLED